MKKNFKNNMKIIKNSRYLLVLMFLFASTMYFGIDTNLEDDKYNSKPTNIYHPFREIKISKSWNLTGTSFAIDDNSHLNWTYYSITVEWCNGSGTISDPFIIENVTVDKISIINSNVHFIIRNCITEFFLEKTDNGILINNTCSNHDFEGIYLRDCDNNTISNNIISNNWRYGIYFDPASSNRILGNKIIGNGVGLKVGGNNNEIIGNYIHDNTDYGIHIQGSNSNLIYKNYFIGNVINAFADLYINYWDNGTIGNYWDDYNGRDVNDDGIGDTPYSILDSEYNIDNFPIWDDGPELPFFLTLGIVIGIITIPISSVALVYNKKRINRKRLKGIISKKYLSRDIEKIRKIKKILLEMGTKLTRVELAEIIEQTGISNQKLLTQTIMNMINNKEIFAQYYSSSKALVFDQQANIDEIDQLMKIFKEWEEKEGEEEGKI